MGAKSTAAAFTNVVIAPAPPMAKLVPFIFKGFRTEDPSKEEIGIVNTNPLYKQGIGYQKLQQSIHPF